MSIVARVDAFTRRHPRSGYPLAVLYKFFDDQGGYLAALIAYYAVVSLFPLLMLLTAILGIVLKGDPELQNRIVDSVLQQIPVIGSQLKDTGELPGDWVSASIALAGLLYGGLGVSVASQNAMNVIWAVPRNDRPNPIKVRVRGFFLLCTIGVAVTGLVVLNTMAATIEVEGLSRGFLRAGTIVLAIIVFTVAFRLGTVRELRVVDVLPGAVVAGVGWQFLQEFGSYYVLRVVARASAVNSVFAVVLGLIAFAYVAGVLVVLSLEINAVRVDRLYPRSLLTPFTDNVVLTRGDRAVYRNLAKAQRNKGFEIVDVRFRPHRDHGAGDPGRRDPDEQESPGPGS
ncbi:YihY/virulence factor BrkB family protein [Gordonia sp. VNK21]|uniref:YihY/virulence factor BrkB family protein n=1 Tax=Gordonia sp. VNK21 TaxID=3382483 RepID=UPI0038D48D78